MRVKESFIDLKTPTGIMRTYLYEPISCSNDQTKQWSGLLLYSEIFQQTAPIKRLALQFCSHGYIVMVPEIYHEHEPAGTVLGYDEQGRNKGNAYKEKTKLSSFDDGAKVVIDALKTHPHCSGRLGVIGFCIGGHLAFRAALHPEILSAACFYPTDIHSATPGMGGCDDSLLRTSEIKAELMFMWGKQDPHIPAEGRTKIYQALKEAGNIFTWHEFNGEHAFMRDEGPRYDAALARYCVGLALELFHRTL